MGEGNDDDNNNNKPNKRCGVLPAQVCVGLVFWQFADAVWQQSHIIRVCTVP